MKNNKTDKAIMDFVRLSIENPEILEDSEKAKEIAKSFLIKNEKISKEKEVEKDRA